MRFISFKYKYTSFFFLFFALPLSHFFISLQFFFLFFLFFLFYVGSSYFFTTALRKFLMMSVWLPMVWDQPLKLIEFCRRLHAGCWTAKLTWKWPERRRCIAKNIRDYSLFYLIHTYLYIYICMYIRTSTTYIKIDRYVYIKCMWQNIPKQKWNEAKNVAILFFLLQM